MQFGHGVFGIFAIFRMAGGPVFCTTLYILCNTIPPRSSQTEGLTLNTKVYLMYGINENKGNTTSKDFLFNVSLLFFTFSNTLNNKQVSK